MIPYFLMQMTDVEFVLVELGRAEASDTAAYICVVSDEIAQ